MIKKTKKRKVIVNTDSRVTVTVNLNVKINTTVPTHKQLIKALANGITAMGKAGRVKVGKLTIAAPIPYRDR